MWNNKNNSTIYLLISPVFYYFGSFSIILDSLSDIIDTFFLTIISINANILHYFAVIHRLFLLFAH